MTNVHCSSSIETSRSYARSLLPLHAQAPHGARARAEAEAKARANADAAAESKTNVEAESNAASALKGEQLKAAKAEPAETEEEELGRIIQEMGGVAASWIGRAWRLGTDADYR